MKDCNDVNAYFNNLIYKNPVVIAYTPSSKTENNRSYSKARQLLKDKFNQDSLMINLRQIPIDYEILEKCLIQKYKASFLPMIFINGMMIGNFTKLTTMDFNRDLDIFFK